MTYVIRAYVYVIVLASGFDERVVLRENQNQSRPTATACPPFNSPTFNVRYCMRVTVLLSLSLSSDPLCSITTDKARISMQMRVLLLFNKHNFDYKCRRFVIYKFSWLTFIFSPFIFVWKSLRFVFLFYFYASLNTWKSNEWHFSRFCFDSHH